MSLVLGIDGGSTKTVCVLMDSTGQVLGRGEAGGSNYQSAGKEAAFDSIQLAIATAMESTEFGEVASISLGLAGVARPKDVQVAHSFIEHLGFKDAEIAVCHDALIALVGGLGHDVGIVALAGTGSMVYGRNQQGRTQRVGGWGHVLGDEGSAYYIAVRGMQAAMRGYDGRSQPTILQQSLRHYLRLINLEDLVEIIYQRGWGVREIAAIAPIVDRAAASGDEVALGIIEDAVQELALATQRVIQGLFSTVDVCVVTGGSVWDGESQMRARFAQTVTMLEPMAKVIPPQNEPAYGAALLALDAIGKAQLGRYAHW